MQPAVGPASRRSVSVARGAGMAFMRMMGRESVAYHRATVLGRGDDHPGQVLDYYGSRGETPLVWGGSGAARLGLGGAVTPLTYGAVFGDGGTVDPVTGNRLVSTRRPGMELVVSPHKSVAVLGAIGRADDMHAIVDAETKATLDYVDAWFRERGGRRGRDQVRTATSGLVWAVTRHGTSRAGDPAVHDHVLVANIVEMGDLRGGWKALDTAALRDVLHAATIVGRAAAARRAAELGYAIEADEGRSGRLRGWRIAGIPDAVCDLFSKRSAEIDDFVDDRGVDSYRARAVAARTTRSAKIEQAPDLLAVRWHAELTGIGWAPSRVLDSIDQAECPVAAVLDDRLLADMIETVTGPGSRLGAAKVLSRRDLVVEVGPHLYGHPIDLLDVVVDRILHSELVVPVVAVNAAREQVYAPTRALAVEQAIADTVERLAAQPVRPVPAALSMEAIAGKERELGGVLTSGQAAAVLDVGAGRGRVQFLVGVAGAGKTTALDAATAALEADGWNVIGTSTSGQAARTLGAEAGIHSRTVASLLWRLDHGLLPLSPRSVVVLDEAAMTTDDDLLRLVSAIDVTGGRLVVVGDPVQLGAVGPGGAMAALMRRHPDLVTTMEENVRQHDPDERAVLADLRGGRIRRALDWYVANKRIQPAPTLDDALDHVVAAWDRDVTAGRSTTMLAWRRDHVAELNRQARAKAVGAGRVDGPGLALGGGFEIAAGDELVALTPIHRVGIVTSQHLTVTHVDSDRQIAVLATGDDRIVELIGAELSGGQVGYGYATTIHRAQGATFDTCHVYADGGTHHLAYVALSRARHSTEIHCVADDRAQAVEDLAAAWQRPDPQRWIIDDQPDPAHADRTPRRIAEDLLQSRRRVEHDTLEDLRARLTDTTEIARLVTIRRELEDHQVDLRAGTGAWANSPGGNAGRRLVANQHARDRAVRRAEAPGLSRRDRRALHQEIEQLDEHLARAQAAWQRHGEPVDARLTRDIEAVDERIADQPNVLDQWETGQLLDRRLHHLEVELGIVPDDPLRRRAPRPPGPGPSLGLGL